jgi:hypothetical protein
VKVKGTWDWLQLRRLAREDRAAKRKAKRRPPVKELSQKQQRQPWIAAKARREASDVH